MSDLLQAAIAQCNTAIDELVPEYRAYLVLRATLAELAAYHAWSATGFTPEGPLYGNWVAAHGETERAVKAFVGGAE